MNQLSQADKFLQFIQSRRTHQAISQAPKLQLNFLIVIRWTIQLAAQSINQLIKWSIN